MKEQLSNTPQITKEDREEAIKFYFHSLNTIQREWVEAGKHDREMDPDVIALAKLLSEVRHSAETRGFLSGLAAVVKSTDKVKVLK